MIAILFKTLAKRRPDIEMAKPIEDGGYLTLKN